MMLMRDGGSSSVTGRVVPFDQEVVPAGTVRELQQQLNSIADTMPGLPHLQITGRLGTMTQRAVEKFQKNVWYSGQRQVE